MNRTAARVLTTSALAAAFIAAAPASYAASATGMDVSLDYTVKGNTITYTYSESGKQYALASDNGPIFMGESTGYNIDFGDGGLSDGADGMGGLTCMTTGAVKPFKNTMRTASHTYAKPGTYTVTVIAGYCSGKNAPQDGNASLVKKTYRVTVGQNAVGSTKPAPVNPVKPAPAVTKPAPVNPATPNAATAPDKTGKPAAPVTGPKVVTGTTAADNNAAGVAIGLGAIGVLSAAGVGVARTRRTN